MASVGDYFPKKHAQAADLQGREVTAVIDKVAPEDFVNDGVKSTKPVLHFRGGKLKPVVMNKTNFLIASKILGDDDSTWPGKRVTLGTELVSFNGRVVESIRIKQPATAAPPTAEEPPPFDDDPSF